MPKQHASTSGFPQRLRAWRKEHDIGARDFAKALGITVATLYYYENGRSFPQVSKLITLAQVFQADLNFLLTGQSLPQPLPLHEEALPWITRVLTAGIKVERFRAQAQRQEQATEQQAEQSMQAKTLGPDLAP